MHTQLFRHNMADYILSGHAYLHVPTTEKTRFLAELKEIEKTQYVRNYYLAMVYAALGEKDNAFAELGKSFRDKDCYLPRARVDPFMDPLREDARFKDMMKRMGLTE